MSRHQFIVTFTNENDILGATQKVRDEDLKIIDAYTPYPVHGLDKAMGLRPSRLTWACFVGGAVGLFGMLWLQHWTGSIDWPIDVGGKPWNSLPGYIPVAFEGLILVAGIVTVLSFFVVARMYPGKKAYPVTPNVTNDQFALVIEETQRTLNRTVVEAILVDFDVVGVEERVQ